MVSRSQSSRVCSLACRFVATALVGAVLNETYHSLSGLMTKYGSHQSGSSSFQPKSRDFPLPTSNFIESSTLIKHTLQETQTSQHKESPLLKSPEHISDQNSSDQSNNDVFPKDRGGLQTGPAFEFVVGKALPPSSRVVKEARANSNLKYTTVLKSTIILPNRGEQLATTSSAGDSTSSVSRPAGQVHSRHSSQVPDKPSFRSKRNSISKSTVITFKSGKGQKDSGQATTAPANSQATKSLIETQPDLSWCAELLTQEQRSCPSPPSPPLQTQASLLHESSPPSSTHAATHRRLLQGSDDVAAQHNTPAATAAAAATAGYAAAPDSAAAADAEEEEEREDAQRLQAFFFAAQNPDPSRCSKARYLDASPGSGGLTSKLNRVAHALLLASLHGRVLLVSWPLRYVDPWRCPSLAWACTFEPLSGTCGERVGAAVQAHVRGAGTSHHALAPRYRTLRNFNVVPLVANFSSAACLLLDSNSSSVPSSSSGSENSDSAPLIPPLPPLPHRGLPPERQAEAQLAARQIVERMNRSAASARHGSARRVGGGTSGDLLAQLRRKAGITRFRSFEWVFAQAVLFVSRPNADLAAFTAQHRTTPNTPPLLLPVGGEAAAAAEATPTAAAAAARFPTHQIAVHVRRQDKRKPRTDGRAGGDTHYVPTGRYVEGVLRVVNETIEAAVAAATAKRSREEGAPRTPLTPSSFTVFFGSDDNSVRSAFRHRLSKAGSAGRAVGFRALPERLFMASGEFTERASNGQAKHSREAAKTVSWRYKRRGSEQPAPGSDRPTFDESFALMAQLFLMAESRGLVVTSTSNVGRLVRSLAIASRALRGGGSGSGSGSGGSSSGGGGDRGNGGGGGGNHSAFAASLRWPSPPATHAQEEGEAAVGSSVPLPLFFVDLDGCGYGSAYHGCSWLQPLPSLCDSTTSPLEVEAYTGASNSQHSRHSAVSTRSARHSRGGDVCVATAGGEEVRDLAQRCVAAMSGSLEEPE